LVLPHSWCKRERARVDTVASLDPVKAGFKAAANASIDFAGIHQELVSHKYLTLQLLWEEYKQSNLDGYQYSWFCQRYRDWLKTRDLVLRQDHRAGEKLFVDHAGGTIHRGRVTEDLVAAWKDGSLKIQRRVPTRRILDAVWRCDSAIGRRAPATGPCSLAPEDVNKLVHDKKARRR
jgi:hypothetical protein